MNSNQISFVLNSSSSTRKIFRGVFPSNKIPNFNKDTKYPFSFVANTDPQGQPGKHWVGFFVTSPNKIEYFDSFGRWPPESKEIKRYLLTNYEHVIKNSEKIQAVNENSCGPHVIYFIVRRSLGQTFRQIICALNRLHPYDDAYVKYHVYQSVYKH